MTTTHPPGSNEQENQEADLMTSFLELKRIVQDASDLDRLPLPQILGPFFAIIRSSLSTGPITSSALSALHSFFVSGIICPESKNLEVALAEMSHTVAHCKFEASDSSGDEVVLLKIMTVIEDSLCRGVGKVLGDVEVCEMLETVLTTCCQMRLSAILRRSAESTMDSLVRSVFSRLHFLEPDSEEAKLRINEDASEGDVKMTISSQDVAAQHTSENNDQLTETVPLTQEGEVSCCSSVSPPENSSQISSQSPIPCK
jgi:brefeldin A-resistance guanine nucleotide exchange factor 1